MKETSRTAMITLRVTALLAALLVLAAAGCRQSSPWVSVDSGQKIYSMLDVPLRELHEKPEDYLGTVFEDRFKFYRIYHDREDADPAIRGQVIEGETHFTARPVNQYLQMIQVQITPRQEAWIRERGIERQDALRLRLRFTGIAPGASLAFELLEILDPPGAKG